MLHCNIETQEFVLARPTTKKPAPRRAPAARPAKAVAQPVGEGASEAVEWPVGAAEAKVQAVEIVATPQAEPVVEPTPTPEPAAKAAEQSKGTFIMTDAMETAKTYAEEAKTRIQGAVAEMNEKAKVAMEKSAKAMEELGDLAKGNLEAIVESSKIAAKGVEALGQEAVEYGRKSFETSTATFKKFAAIKSPTEFFQLQSELMSSAMDGFASEAAKSSEAMLKLAGDVSQPISNRVAIVTEKMKALAA
jgi:phasin family protein